MADLAISVAGKLIELIGSDTVERICTMWGYKDDLEKLKKTIITIKNVLLDAESKRDLTNLQKCYISELKDAVYDADDLFDEFRTLAELDLISGSKRGKTTLAQLVFGHEKILNEFAESRYWVCVSDPDGLRFDVKTILLKILEEGTKKSQDNNSSMQLLQNQFQGGFSGKKYLLVLDAVWNENHDNWVKLKKFLMMGARGSKIVVTTRSEKTGSIIGSKNVFKLKGLSIGDSQCLFEMSAFEGVQKHPELVTIGENITRKCCGIPLAIKIVGSLLYGQDIGKWNTIEKIGLIDNGEDNSDNILSILKLSYFNLAPSLKSCFSYCALFPKDYEMEKEILISLWIAQGYIVSLVKGQSVEDAAEKHFSILMQRCFFQDIRKDTYGNVISAKIHDLMHDVAQEVGKEEICVSSKASKLGEKVCHVNIIDVECSEIPLCGNKIRSYFGCRSIKHFFNKQVNLIALRMLTLFNLDITSLPQNVDRLLLLRYLNISGNKSLEVLPNSITKLYNLQTLVLRDCQNLREVPKDLSKLINLRHLDLYGCYKLNGMPLGISKLRNLKVLPYFVETNEIFRRRI